MDTCPSHKPSWGAVLVLSPGCGGASWFCPRGGPPGSVPRHLCVKRANARPVVTTGRHSFLTAVGI